jgi:putative DNA primase/helicase
MDLTLIPAELRERPQWVCWRRIERAGKTSKVPYQATRPRCKAASDDPASWSTYPQALTVYEQGRCDGIGYVFSADDTFVGCDLDHCRDPKTGQLDPVAESLTRDFATYQEASQSGTGVHIIMVGRKPEHAGCKKPFHGVGVEIYETGRYFCVTGDRLGEVSTVRDCQVQLEDLCRSVWPARPVADRKPRSAAGASLEDRELIEKMLAAKNAHNVAALYGGDTSAYGDDHSSADQALLVHLAWWTNNDAVQMERIFRASGLYREKWERQDYREMSIAKAVETNGASGYAGERSQATCHTGEFGPDAPATGEPRPKRPHHCTDSGNAKRLIDYCGERVRYCASDSAWYVYDRRRWAQDTTLQVEDLAGKALRGIYNEAAEAGDSEKGEMFGKWAVRSEAAARRRAAVEIARSNRRVAIRPSDFNRNGWLLNCQNGTLDLRSGELRTHDPADLISKLAPVTYDPKARSPLWERVLAAATGGDEDYLRHLQRFLGYCLTAEVAAEYFAVAIGGTETSKSTILGAVSKVMGDYAADVQPETFCTKDRVGGTRDDLLRLAGVRLALIPEADKRRHLDEAMLKRFVSGEGWPERGIYQRERDLQPVAKVVFHTNEMPQMSDDDDAVWRRALSWPFTHRPQHIHTSIKPTLLDPVVSGPAILRWLVDGCLAWQRAGGAKKGLGRATTVDEAKEAMRRSMNPLTDFFDEVCVFEGALWCSRSRLRAAYTSWCKEGNARRPIGAREFNSRLRAREVVDQTGTEGGRGVDGWAGIGLKGPSA